MTHPIRSVLAAIFVGFSAAHAADEPTPVEARLAELKTERQAEWDAKSITLGDKTMKFEYRVLGEAPAQGRSLFISMHGGGGAPARVNDQQWQNQIGLYTPKEGVYLAPRAPTDTWNLWHEAHIDAFVDRLIENAIAFEGVNPNRIYLMGYSAGGDGTYQLAPRMADRFAAASMMAGHPNEASPINLANLPFMLWVGENDSAYNRNTVTKQWGARLDELAAELPGHYVHELHVVAGAGHWMNRKDAAALEWMSAHTRNPWPTSIRWRQDDVTHDRFYWLQLDAEGVRAHRASGGTISATVTANHIDLETPDGLHTLSLMLSSRLLDLTKPVTVTWNQTPLPPQTVKIGRASCRERV